MENTKQKYILDGEIPLGTSVNCSRNYSHYLWNYGLPENLQYRKDLLRVTMEQEKVEEPVGSELYVERIITFFTVEILENTFQALNEYAFVMAHLEIVEELLDGFTREQKENESIEITAKGRKIKHYSYLSVYGHLCDKLSNELNQFMPVKTDGWYHPFHVLGVQVDYNNNSETCDKYPYRLDNGRLIKLDKDADLKDIAVYLMHYMVELDKAVFKKHYDYNR